MADDAVAMGRDVGGVENAAATQMLAIVELVRVVGGGRDAGLCV